MNDGVVRCHAQATLQQGKQNKNEIKDINNSIFKAHREPAMKAAHLSVQVCIQQHNGTCQCMAGI